MANPFDQFDAVAEPSEANPFDQFDQDSQQQLLIQQQTESVDSVPGPSAVVPTKSDNTDDAMLGSGSPSTGEPHFLETFNFNPAIPPGQNSPPSFKGDTPARFENASLAEGIRQIESRGDYNIFAGQNESDQDLSNMTIDQVITFQQMRPANQKAAGAYQIIPETMFELVKNGVVKPTDKFTPATQDKMFSWLLNDRRKIGKFIEADDYEGAAIELAKEWASFPVPRDMTTHDGRQVKKGQSYYSGVGGNLAHVTPEQVDSMLRNEKSGQPLNPMQNKFRKALVEKLGSEEEADKVIAERGFWSNTGRRVGERATEIAGQLTQFVADRGDELESVAGLGGFVWNEGDILPSYANAEEWKALQENPEFGSLGTVAQSMKDMDFNSVPVETWDKVKNSWSDDDTGMGTAMADTALYIAETGLTSLPDMVAAVFTLPTYVLARSQEIGEKRARNLGREKADLSDVAAAAPFALASSMLDRIGAKGILQAGDDIIADAGKNVFKDVIKSGAKAAGKEAGTEALQEGLIEYTGERVGTYQEMKLMEALDQAFAGAVAGGGFGGASGVSVASAKELAAEMKQRNMPSRIGKLLEADVDAATFEKTAEQIAIEQMNADNAGMTLSDIVPFSQEEIQQGAQQIIKDGVEADVQNIFDQFDTEQQTPADLEYEAQPGTEFALPVEEPANGQPTTTNDARAEDQKPIQNQDAGQTQEAQPGQADATKRDDVLAGTDYKLKKKPDEKNYTTDLTQYTDQVFHEGKKAAASKALEKKAKQESDRVLFLEGKIPEDTTEQYATWVKSLSPEMREKYFGEDSKLSVRNAAYMNRDKKLENTRKRMDEEGLPALEEITKKANAGDLSAIEYQDGFKWLIDNEQKVKTEISKLTKAQILAKLPPMAAARSKNEKKGYAVKALYGRMMESFNPSFEPMSYVYEGKDSYRNALQKKVDSLTDEDVQAFRDERAKKVAEFEQQKADYKKALDNPETLEEFQAFIKRKGKDALSNEQLKAYDELKSDALAERKKEKEKTGGTVEAVNVDAGMEMKKTTHTKTGEDLFVITLTDRVDRDQFSELRAKAKKFGGWYSRFNKGGAIPGFQFKTEADAKSFMGLQEGDQTTEERQERRGEEKQDKRITKLRALATSLKEKGEEKLNQDRRTNTSRQAAQAASSESSARKQIAFAETLNQIADAVDQGEAKYLSNISAATQLETLLSIQRQAIPNDMLTDPQFDGYSISGRDLKKGITVDDYVKFAKYPEPVIWGSNAVSLGKKMEQTPGYKLAGARLIKAGAKNPESRIKLNEADAQKAIDWIKKEKSYEGGWLVDHMANMKRLRAMGIDTDAQLRAAIRELDSLTAVEVKEDPIKAQERKLVGSKIAGYFPTPKAIVEEMVADADIKPGDVILEPSAGKGDIAQVIREEYPSNKLDVVEYNSTLRELLEMKEFNVIGSDIMQRTGQAYDVVIMNPPFENFQDIDHIQHVFNNLLKPGGRIVAIAGAGVMNSRKKAAEFREWVEQNNGWIEELPQGSFLSSDRPTGVSTVRIVVTKDAETQKPANAIEDTQRIEPIEIEQPAQGAEHNTKAGETTPGNIQAIDDAADDVYNNGDDPAIMKKWLNGRIDKAMKEVKGSDDQILIDYRILKTEVARIPDPNTAFAKIDSPSEQEIERFEKLKEQRNKKLEELRELEEKLPFVEFNVKGDGKFKILKFEDNLAEFKRKVNASKGFTRASKKRTTTAGRKIGKPTESAVANFILDGELENAYNMAINIDKPMRYGKNSNGVIPYTRIKDVDIGGGLNVFVGWNPQEGWQVVEESSGMSVNGKTGTESEKKAIAESKDRVKNHLEKMLKTVQAQGKPTMQADLEKQFVGSMHNEGTQADRTPETNRSASVDQPMPGYEPMYARIGVPPRVERMVVNGQTIRMPTVEKPMRRERIRTMLQKIVGDRLYFDKIKGKRTKGFYRHSNGEIRMKNFDDVEVMAHEMAHYLDFHYNQDHIAFENSYKGRSDVEQFSYTSDKDLKGSEGFAEFVRLWLTRYDSVTQKAPEYTAIFDELLKTDAKLHKQMMQLQKMMHQWYFQGTQAQLRAKSGNDIGIVGKTENWITDHSPTVARQQLLDRFHASKVIERTLKGEIQEATKSMYKQFQLINGAESTYEAIMNWGTPNMAEDGSFEFNGKGLLEIFEPASKKGAKQFNKLMDYFKAMRGAELMEQERENLFTAEEIAAGLKYGQENPEFEQIFLDYQEFNARMLDWYVQMGLITEDMKDAFQEMNKNYVPFQRIVEQVSAASDGTGSQIGKRLKGGTMNTKDIAENIVDGLFSNVRGALIARAKQTMYKEIARHPDGALFAARIGPDSKIAKANIEEMAKKVSVAMADFGIGIYNDQVITANPDSPIFVGTGELETYLAENPEFLMFFTHGHKPTTVQTYVDQTIIGGRTVYFEVKDRQLVDMLESLSPPNWGAFMRMFFRVKNFTTRSITSLPPFLVPNAFRDTVSSAVISTNKFKPVADTLIGMQQYLMKTDAFKLAMLNGAGYGTRIEAHTEELRARRALDLPSENMFDVATKLLAGYERFASAFEYGSRIGDFRLGLKEGKSPLEAAWEAREITTDFGKIGSNGFWAGFIRTVPFMNAGLQGVDKTARKIFEMQGEMSLANTVRLRDMEGKVDTEKAMFLLKAMPLTIGTLALFAINSDDERYKQLTVDEKVRFWHMWVDDPDLRRILGVPNTGHIKFPKPYDIGHIFASIPESIMNYIYSEHGDEAGKMITFAMMNTLGMFDYPGIARPMIEVMQNEKFTGAPIVPPYLDAATPEYAWQEYTDRTPEIYVRLGKLLNVSPLIAEHMVKGYTGYLEMALTDATEAYFWDEEKWGPQPFPRKATDYVAKQFRNDRQPFRTKYTEGYYDLRARSQDTKRFFTRLQNQAVLKDKTDKDLKAWFNAEGNALLVELDKHFAKMNRELTDLPDIITAVKYNPDMTREEKEQQIEKLYQGKNKVISQMYIASEKALFELEKQQAKKQRERR